MGCIRVERITEYLSKPLQMGLADEDPYVRKTAAIGVAKLYDISPSMARDQGFIEKLRDLLSDGNPTVVANAVAALSEIQDASARDVFDITSAVLQKLLAALNECTEWGQVFILDALARYEPSDEREAESVIDRVVPRLAHQNSAVVLSAVKIVMKFLEYVTTQESITQFSRKLAPPLVTLAQAQQPEIQYVALRNINLVVQKRPALLARNIKVFFCKYNDPIYVKMEKLDILVRLATERNIDQVLLELKEYASEVDVDFVRKATRTIGRCAIKLEGAAERCIKVLLQLIRTKVNYVVQEAVVVIKDIFRRYPNRYESVISVLCDALDDLDEPEAKASMIWIIGEYADRIENAGELLESFLDGFAEEPAAVQLQLLTATVKLFLHKPDSADEVVQRVLRLATEESDNPDLRDRGYIYWRLLSEDPDAASAVVLAQKPVISDTTDYLDEDLLQLLIGQISTLASVYHKPPEAFVARARGAGEGLSDSESSSSDDEGSDGGSDGSSSDDDSEGGAAGADPAGGGMLDTGVDDLLGFGIGGDSGAAPAPAPAPAATVYDTTSGGGGGGGGLDDLFGGSDEPQAAAAPVKPAPRDPLGEKGGISLRGGLVRRDGQTVLDLEIHNGGGSAMHQCALKFNFNAFGLVPVAAAFALPSPVPPGSTGNALVPLQFADSQVKPSGPVQPFFEAALRDNASGTVVFFKCPVPYDALLKQNAHVSKSDFLALWKALPEENESSVVVRLSIDTSIRRVAVCNNMHAFHSFGVHDSLQLGSQYQLPSTCSHHNDELQSLIFLPYTVYHVHCAPHCRPATCQAPT